MDSEFIVRFILPSIGKTPDDKQFNSSDIDISDEEVRRTVYTFNSMQANSADDFRNKYGEKIKALEGKRVLFVGDSLTMDRLGYRGIVSKAGRLEVKNASFSGATSTDMYRFIYETIHSFKPEIVSVMIGTNDAFKHCGAEKNHLVSPCEYRRNIKGIFGNCVKSGARTIVSTIPQMDEDAFRRTRDALFKDNSDKNIAVYNEIIREEAALAGAELIDLEAALKTKPKDGIYQPDGVHLSFYGQNILADLWLEKVLGKEV